MSTNLPLFGDEYTGQDPILPRLISHGDLIRFRRLSGKIATGIAWHMAVKFRDRPNPLPRETSWTGAWWVLLSEINQALVGRHPRDPQRLAVVFAAPWFNGGDAA